MQLPTPIRSVILLFQSQAVAPLLGTAIPLQSGIFQLFATKQGVTGDPALRASSGAPLRKQNSYNPVLSPRRKACPESGTFSANTLRAFSEGEADVTKVDNDKTQTSSLACLVLVKAANRCSFSCRSEKIRIHQLSPQCLDSAKVTCTAAASRASTPNRSSRCSFSSDKRNLS